VYNAPWFRIEARGKRHPDGKPSLLQIYQYHLSKTSIRIDIKQQSAVTNRPPKERRMGVPDDRRRP
jgi:hypothetical protein